MTTQTPAAPVPEALRIGTGEAAGITGLHPRTIERYIDAKHVRGGRPANPITGRPIPRSHRWVHIEDVVLMAVDLGRGDQVPDRWRHLIPAQPNRSSITAA